MSPPYEVEVYQIRSYGWLKAKGDKWYFAVNVPASVQRLYVAEGWTTIAYQRLDYAGTELVYPISETAKGGAA